MIDTAFFNDSPFTPGNSFASEEGIHILIRVFVEFSVNGKRTAIHAILVTFQKESSLLFL